jgi:TldD protein
MKPLLSEALSGLVADYADIRVEEVERTRIVFRGRSREELRMNFEVGGCLRIFKRGNWAFASFNRLEAGLDELAEDAMRHVDLMPWRDERLVKLPAADESLSARPEDDPRGASLEQKVGLIRDYNSILLRAPRIATTRAVYEDCRVNTFFYSTEDRYIAQERRYCGVGLSGVARDGTNEQEYGRNFGRTMGFESLRGLESEVEGIGRVAADLLSAEGVSAGRYTVVIDPRLAGVLAAEAFGHLLEVSSQETEDRGQLAIGRGCGIAELAIVDDGRIPFAWGSVAFDDEGAPSGKRYLIEDGEVRGHLHSRESAWRMKEDVTGNARAVSYQFAPTVRMTNTYVEPRAARLEELLDGIEDGLYVVGVRGEPRMNAFCAQYAYRIRMGRVTGEMVRDVVLWGDVFETLRNIDAIGNDLQHDVSSRKQGRYRFRPENRWCPCFPVPISTGGPHVRVRNVAIGGK